MMFDLKNKKVTVIGAARSGIAVANTVIKLGGIAKVSEFKMQSAVEGELAHLEHPEAVAIECGGHTHQFIEDSDYVVLSPGVKLDMAPVGWAKAKGIEVMGEIEFAFRLCPCPIVAVTGSNGKTTTVTVIAEILKKAGRGVVLCGNIGSPFSKHVLGLKPTDTVVLEISSFQLESTVHFKPRVAVWLNFSQNHLDRHKDLAEYYDAKQRIFANQDGNDWAVLNAQQAEFKDLSKGLTSRVIWFNDKDVPGVTNPNYLAALAATAALGVPEDVAREVFGEFKGVEHRMEFVRNLKGVDFINDSKSTTVEAGRWILERADKPMVLICGGSDKCLDYTPLRSLVQKKVKHMIAIGEIRHMIKSAFGDVVSLEIAETFEGAVKAAQMAAQDGDAVVLSPMTASFDMFNDYEHRGRVFKEIVNGLS